MTRVGQDKPRPQDADSRKLDDGGFLMVVLLIGMAVTAVWMSALLPSWHQQAVREKEAELIFRGEQYARAIALYYRKNQRLPPNIDTLVSQRYLRKKYVDPITGKEFIPVGGVVGQQPSGQGRAPAGGPPAATAPGQAPGGVAITGVRSTSTDTSIVVYLNQQTYSQFPFDYNTALLKMGVTGLAGAGGRANGRANGRAGRGDGGRGDELAPIGPRGGRGGGGAGPARGGPAGAGRGGAGGGGVGGRGQPGGFIQGGVRGGR